MVVARGFSEGAVGKQCFMGISVWDKEKKLWRWIVVIVAQQFVFFLMPQNLKVNFIF